MDKKAYNPIKEKGFDSKAQVRLLLMRARELPDMYGWVLDALKDHGWPKEDGPLKTYWDEPYRVSPDSPSYKYISPTDKAIFKKPKKYKADLTALQLVKIAEGFEELGLNKAAESLDKIVVKRMSVDDNLVEKITNQFWTITKDKSLKDKQLFALQLFKRLENFEPFKQVDTITQVAIKNRISDKLMGRA